MDINGKAVAKQLADTHFEGDVLFSIKKKYKYNYIPFRMFGMNTKPASMSLIHVLDKVEGHRWRTKAFKLLLMHLNWGSNISILSPNLFSTSTDKRQFRAALQFLAANNIAVKLTRKNTKEVKLTYNAHSWILNPKIVYIPDNYELDAFLWKNITGNDA